MELHHTKGANSGPEDIYENPLSCIQLPKFTLPKESQSSGLIARLMKGKQPQTHSCATLTFHYG